MCSFVAIKAHNIQLSLKKDERLNIFSKILDVKGGDEYNFVFINENTRGIHYISNYEFYTELQSSFADKPTSFTSDEKLKILKKLVEQKNYMCGTFIAFSRATPEMESDVKTLSQPYIDVYNGTVSVCHGTIPKADQIAKDLNCNIQVDTELFLYNDFENVLRMNEYYGGKVSALQYNVKDNNIIMYHNGLGLYQYNIMVSNSSSTETWISNINLSFDTRKARGCAIEKRVLNQGFVYEKFDANTFNYLGQNEGEIPSFRLISLHSGGLDISLSVQKVLDQLSIEYNNIYNSVDLLYFDWGTRAREGEIRSGKELVTYLQNDFSCVATSFKHHTLPAKDFFKNYLGMLDVENCRLTDKDAVGAGEAEAEAAISYVPYRNTILLTAAAAWAEQKYPNERCIFVIGANLSEGMVYLDNSETYITLMNQLVKVGGQKSALFEVRAPYMNYTKTKMVKDAVANGFSLHSFSCYFPKEDGTECGECGSCLLKNTAIKRAKNK